MKNTTAIKEIEEIISAVREGLTANDGGLTMAASDLIAFGQSIIRRIECGDAKWLWELDPTNGNTGAETEIVDIALHWAKTNLEKGII